MGTASWMTFSSRNVFTCCLSASNTTSKERRNANNARLPQIFLYLQFLNAHRKALSSQFPSSGELLFPDSVDFLRPSLLKPFLTHNVSFLFFFKALQLLHTVQIKTPFNSLNSCLFGYRLPTLLPQAPLSSDFLWPSHILVVPHVLPWLSPFQIELW